MPAAQNPDSPNAIPATPAQLDQNTTASATTQTTNQSNSPGQNAVAAATTTATTTQQNQQTIANQLSSVGINFNPVQNPLNVYANYTYHIRWFQTNELVAYSVGITSAGSNVPNSTIGLPTPSLYPTKAVADGFPKMVIAESGVTAGFNIKSFEFVNLCSPGPKNLNSHMMNWTMVVTEPFGFSLIDKIRSGSLAMNYLRCPYFVDIWFDGYDDNGNVQTNLFYKLYRITIADVDIKYTEAGAMYTLTGFCDGDIGMSNEIAIPPGQLSIQAKTVGDFFSQLQTKLNVQTKAVNEQPTVNPNITYSFVIPSDIKSWQLKQGDPQSQPQQNSDMTVPYDGITMNIKTGHGTSMEAIINQVMSLSPEALQWVKATGFGSKSGSDYNTTGNMTWPMLHPVVTITGFDLLTQDYVRNVQYNLVPFLSPNIAGDLDSVNNQTQQSVQQAGFAFLAGNNSLVKEYDYYYTGLNTEIIKWDIAFKWTWSTDLAQFQANNNYGDFASKPKYDPNQVGNERNEGRYNPTPKGQQGIQANTPTATAQNDINTAIQNLGAAERIVQLKSNGQLSVSEALGKINPALAQQLPNINAQLAKAANGAIYAEDVQNSPAQQELIPIVIRQSNDPSAPNTNQGSDTNAPQAESSVTTMPGSRSFIGSVLGNLFSDYPSALDIEIEIRGDPYWMGQGNIADDIITTNWAKIASTNIATPNARPTADNTCADFNGCSPAFILTFRTGETYNVDTGLMQFDTNSSFWNGAYQVIEVHNHFVDGKFTQTLKARRYVFQKLLSNALANTQAQARTSNGTAIGSNGRITGSV